jgi:hypothetical protein
MALRNRLIALTFATLAGTAAAVATAAPASAASLVQCESESGYWDCYLPIGYYNQLWYYDGTLVPDSAGKASVGGRCTPGTGHHIEVTFDRGRSVTNFTCR